MKLKVLIADKFPEVYIEQLKANNCEVSYQPKLKEEDLETAVSDFNVVIVRSTVVNEKAILNSTDLKLIIRAGSGYNNINVNAANQKGVWVANCPGKNSIAVAELTMGLIISLDRRIPDNVIDFRNGVWNKGEYSKAEGLYGKTLALIGVGNIGKEVAKRALSFGIKVYGKDIVKIEGVDIIQFENYEEVLPKADIVSIHLPLNANTRGLFNKQMFDLLKPNCLLINTSRAEVIDEDALLEAIQTKNIRFGGDVFKGEPEDKTGAVSSKLQNNKNIYITHHIGASTEQAQNAVAEETVVIINEFMKTGNVLHCVNKK